MKITDKDSLIQSGLKSVPSVSKSSGGVGSASVTFSERIQTNISRLSINVGPRWKKKSWQTEKDLAKNRKKRKDTIRFWLMERGNSSCS